VETQAPPKLWFLPVIFRKTILYSEQFLEAVRFICIRRVFGLSLDRAGFLRPLHINTGIVLWHVDKLLGNDHEISSYTTAIAK
jgi:hypothetical protein